MKINKYIQQTLLLTPLKIVQSASWAILAVVLAFPSFLTNRSYSSFFLKKAMAVWSKNEITSTAKANQIGRTAFSAEKPLEEILNEWVEEKKEEKLARTKAKNALRKWSLFHPIGVTLALNSLRLSSLPDIFHLEPFRSQLTHLQLTDNQLTELPASFGDLRALTYLDLIRNQLTELPASFGNLQALTHLDLSDNQLTELPASFGDLRALTHLDLNRNQLTELPASFGNLRALTHLDLIRNQLTELPASFGDLQALTHLHLIRNQLTELPASFGDLRALTYLDLNHNQLTELPASFGDLRALTHLYLSDNQLTELPASFGDLRALTYLDLNHNQLTELPESLGDLQALTHLHLIRNQLTELPASFGDLRALTYLDLNHNQLTELPASFGDLRALTHLYLSDNQLTELPASFGDLQALTRLDLNRNQLTELPASFGDLQALTHLHLIRNQLTELPASFGDLRALTYLDLNHNQLTELPASFGDLRALTHLYLSDNQLTELPASLPESLGDLQALTMLGLSNNRLSGFPMQMLDLPSTCVIEFTGCNFSPALRSRIRDILNNPEYSGPRISYSIVDRNSNEGKSIQESLAKLYKVINKSPPEFYKEFYNIEETLELKSWLSRLSDTADYKKGGDLQKAIANKIIEYLKQANENQEFREIFCNTIQDASETCGDRVALSLLHLGMAYRLSTIDLKNMKELADFLKGVWAINMLENIARKKTVTLPFFDEIEVYLGYPIKLKEELNLPIDIQEMLYFGCSALKDEDLKEAKAFILKEQASEAAHFKFLITQPEWRKALSANYKEEYEAILEKRSEAAEAANPDYTLIEEDFKQELIALTKNALR